MESNCIYETPQVRVQQCLEPTDRNYKGWDILATMPDGLFVCVGEVNDRTSAIVAARVTNDALDRTQNWPKGKV